VSRKGKIARLPEPMREQLNRRIYDGQSGRAVLAWLNAQPEALAVLKSERFGGKPHNLAFDDNNLAEWKRGGYQDWLRDEKRMATIRERAELAMRMARAAGGSLSENLLARIAAEIDEKLDGISDDDYGKLVPVLQTIIQADKLRLDQARLGEQRAAHALARERFERETCGLLLRMFNDERARQIAEGPESNEEKIDAMRREYFKDVDALEKSGEVQLPR